MTNFLNLFMAQRLTTREPEHLQIIKGILADLKFTDPSNYKKYADFYGVEIETVVTKEPVKVEVTEEKITEMVKPPKKRGRKPKTV